MDLPNKTLIPINTLGVEGDSVSALSAGVYTKTLLVIVDIVKGGTACPPSAPPSPARADFVIMMECMYARNIVIAILCNQRRDDLNGRFQMQGGKKWILHGTLIGWKSGQSIYVPLWGQMEGAWL
jgi:hypothetical protein